MDKNQVNRAKGCLDINKTTITNVYCGYVNGTNHLKKQFSQSLVEMGEEMGGALLKSVRKGISGTMNKNLFNISLGENANTTLLDKIINSDCSDESSVTKLMQAIASCDLIEQKPDDDEQEERDGYVIMLATFQTDMHRKNAKKEEDAEDFGDNIHFLVCSVCQFTNIKETLSYFDQKNKFAAVDFGKMVATPIAGFLYPGVDENNDGDPNAALYHSKNADILNETLLRVVFDAKAPNTFRSNISSFGNMLQKSLDDSCDINMVRKIREKVDQNEEIARADAKNEGKRYMREYMTLDEITEVLEDCGASENQIEQFAEFYQKNEISKQQNYLADLVDPNHFRISTLGVEISLDKENERNVRLDYVNNQRCLIIEVDENTEITVNGIPVR